MATISKVDSGQGSSGGYLARLSRELAEVRPDATAILATATSILSEIKPATWVAAVMDEDPDTSHVVAADETAGDMAAHVDAYVAALDRPHRAPTVGLSKQVIDSGDPILIPSMLYDELLGLLSPAGQAFMRASPPPEEVQALGVLIVPMRVGGSTIGTLGVFDWRQRDLLDERDLAWLQPAADLVALRVEHARLLAISRHRADRLDLVHAITLASTLTSHLSRTLRMIAEQIIARSDVDAADILLETEQGTRLEVVASAGFRSAPPPGHQLPIDPKMSSGAAHRPAVHDLAELDRNGPNPRRTQFEREGFRTLVHVPLYGRTGSIGVIELFNRSFVEWDQDALNFFDTVGGLSALVIESSGGRFTADDVRHPAYAARPKLSDLELEILRFIADGLTNRDIAERVHRSENTVKFRVRRILQEAGALNRADLVRIATRKGWL